MANPNLNPKYPTLNLDTERVVFDKQFISATAAVSARVLRELSAVHRDHTLGMSKVYQELSPVSYQLLITMQTWILKSQHIEKTAADPVYVPTSWWDHLKHDMLESKKGWMVWVAELFKAPKYTIIPRQDIQITRVCPHNDTYFSESKQHIEYLLWRNNPDGAKPWL